MPKKLPATATVPASTRVIAVSYRDGDKLSGFSTAYFYDFTRARAFGKKVGGSLAIHYFSPELLTKLAGLINK